MKLTKRGRGIIVIILFAAAFAGGRIVAQVTHTCDPLPACTAKECKPFAACVDEKAALAACRADKKATVERIERKIDNLGERVCQPSPNDCQPRCPQPYVEGDAGMSVGVARGVPLGHTEPTWIVSCKQLEHGCEPERCPPCEKPHYVEPSRLLFDWGALLRFDDEGPFVDGATVYGSVSWREGQRWVPVVGIDLRRSSTRWEEPNCFLFHALSPLNARCVGDRGASASWNDLQLAVGMEWRSEGER